MTSAPYQPVFHLTRGNIVESIHYGAIAIVDVYGKLIAWHGDPHTATFLRSTAKPLQAIPFIEQGGPQHFSLTTEEIALLCASHWGTDKHVAVVQSIQSKANLSENDLQCGVHPPVDAPTREAMQARGEQPTPNRHNCSGKHSGMLAYAQLNQWPLENYLDPGHPVQQHILRAFSEMCNLPIEQIHLGTDGCSAPNFAVPLYNAALAYARLCAPEVFTPERAATCRTITNAMLSHPDMIAGPGAFDTRLMEVANKKIISKGGAEGFQGFGLLPGTLGTNAPAIGIAYKISDGGSRSTVRAAVGLEILHQIGALTQDEMENLSEFGPSFPVHNWRKLVVGSGAPAFRLTLNQ